MTNITNGLSVLSVRCGSRHQIYWPSHNCYIEAVPAIVEGENDNEQPQSLLLPTVTNQNPPYRIAVKKNENQNNRNQKLIDTGVRIK